MPGTVFSRSRKSILLLAIVAVIGAIVWWWAGLPRDPVYEGRRLSELLAGARTGPSAGNLDWETVQERLPRYGPAGVAWLTYKVAHGKHPFIRRGSLPFDRAPFWLRQRIPMKWGGLREAPPSDERRDAAAWLALYGAEAAPAIPALVKSLESEDSDLIGRAVETLFAIGPEAWPALKRAVEHPNMMVWKSVLNEMRIAPETCPVLQHALECGCPQARVFALECVGYWRGSRWLDGGEEPLSDTGMAQVAKVIAPSCRDPNAEVRAAAVNAIGACYYTRRETALFDFAIPQFAKLLSDPDPNVRWAVADTLKLFEARAAPATPALVRSLESKDEALVRRAATALQYIGPASWPAVRDALQQASPAARAALLQSLSVRFERRDEDSEDRKEAVIVEEILKACRAPEAAVRRAAVEAIRSFCVLRQDTAVFYSTIPELTRLLSDPDATVRAQGAVAIGAFGPKATSAIPRLIELLEDSRELVRACAAQALGCADLAGKRSAERLRIMLNDSDDGCRTAAAEALKALGLPL